MNILISQRHTLNKHGDWVDSLENNYIDFFESFGAHLIPVSNISKNIGGFLNDFSPSGIILSGGGNVNPGLYSGKAGGCGSISEERDLRESRLLEIAIDKNIPVIGICRGMQFINVFFGGKLLGNISGIDKAGIHPVAHTHPIRIVDKRLQSLLDDEKVFQTNSFHKQGVLIEGLGRDIGVFAIFDDLGLAEGIYHKKYSIAGIQWHPERNSSSALLDKVLVNSFLNRDLFWSDVK